MRSESDLLSGELVVEGRLVDASNATLYGIVKMSIADECAVVYKPIAGERPLWDFPDGNLASREVAAYLISKVGKFDCVPTTVLRDGPFGMGAVQEWIESNQEIDIFTLAQSRNDAMRNMALFDVVINNTDRKFGHILPLSDDVILGCDHGVSFHQDFKLRTVLWQFAGDPLTNDESMQLHSLQEWITGEGYEALR